MIEVSQILKCISNVTTLNNNIFMAQYVNLYFFFVNTSKKQRVVALLDQIIVELNDVNVVNGLNLIFYKQMLQ